MVSYKLGFREVEIRRLRLKEENLDNCINFCLVVFREKIYLVIKGKKKKSNYKINM